MNKKVKVGVAALLLAGLVAGNWAANYFETSITAFLCGTGESFDNATLTLEYSDKLCRKVGDESIVLLKNENKTLPMANLDRVNVFGWGGSDEGFLLKGVGSGSSTISAKTWATFLQGISISRRVNRRPWICWWRASIKLSFCSTPRTRCIRASLKIPVWTLPCT